MIGVIQGHMVITALHMSVWGEEAGKKEESVNISVYINITRYL